MIQEFHYWVFIWKKQNITLKKIYAPCIYAHCIAQLVKNPPAIQETLVQFLGREDPLEKG